MTSLPTCGQNCLSNALGLASAYGCASGDTVCLCGNANFGYGIRDCANQSCSSADAQEVISYLASYCASVTNETSSAASSQEGTTYTVFTTTGIATFPVNNSLEVTTYTFTNTITDASVFSSIFSHTPTASDSSVPSGSASATAASPTSANGGNGGSSDGLSTGAKAGIGVGVSLGVILVLCLLAFMFRRSRRQKRRQRDGESTLIGGKAELHSRDLPRTHGRSELSEKRAPVEMDVTSQARVPELSGDVVQIAELRGKDFLTETETGTGTHSSAR